MGTGKGEFMKRKKKNNEAVDTATDIYDESTDDVKAGTPDSSGEDTVDTIEPAKKKAKKEKPAKTSASNGDVNKILIFIIILLAGLGIAGFAVRTVQLNNANEQLASATDANEDYKIKVSRYEKTIANNESDIAELEISLDEANATLSSLEDDVNSYEASAEHYAGYNGLINFFDNHTGSSSSSFFASDSVLHMKKEAVEVYVHVDEKTNLNYVIDNKNIASCEWVGWANDNVAILRVTPGKTIGETLITLTDEGSSPDEDDSIINEDDGNIDESGEDEAPAQTLVIYVYND